MILESSGEMTTIQAGDHCRFDRRSMTLAFRRGNVRLLKTDTRDDKHLVAGEFSEASLHSFMRIIADSAGLRLTYAASDSWFIRFVFR